MTGSNESLEFYKAAKAALNDGREVGSIYVLRLVDRLENDLKEMTRDEQA